MNRFALTAAMLVLVCVPLAAADPSLIAVNVTFNLPKCDDKDDDSSVDVVVLNGSTVIAESKRLGGGLTWNDPGTAGPFPLVLRNAITKSTYGRSTTKIHLNTVGKDTLCASMVVEALFADNSMVVTRSCNVFKISEANRDLSFDNRACP